MNGDDALSGLTAAELLARYETRELSPVDVVGEAAQRIERLEPVLKAFGALSLERAVAEARESERRWRDGVPRRLEGVPFVAKDLFDAEGVTTTYGSRMFEGHVPEQDAAAVQALREAGAILLGKTATHEFAWGITSYNAHFDWGRNPWALDRVSGGSSGGSAVAVAALLAPLALGTDTGGSIRIPAAYCGVSGLKPTFGRTSADGVFPLAPSLDHVGGLARSPADAALLVAVISGASMPQAATSLAGVTIGLCRDLMPVDPAADVAAVFHRTLELLEAAGAVVVDAVLPSAPEILASYRVIQGVEAVDTHRRQRLWPGRKGEYGDDVRARLEGAEALTVEDYAAATLVRERVRAEFGRLFEAVDLLVTPVAPTPPPRLGEEELPYGGVATPFRELVLPYTVPQNFVGLPACAVPAGFDELGIPVGVQLTGPAQGDAAVVRAAQLLFEATPGLEAWPALDA